MPVKCFLVQAHPIFRVAIKGSISSDTIPCKHPGSYHFADKTFFQGTEEECNAKHLQKDTTDLIGQKFVGACRNCANQIQVDIHSVSVGPLWVRADNPDDIRDHIDDFGPGAMYFADYWVSENGLYLCDWDNQTTPPLHVICPGGQHWNIDSRAGNCTMNEDRQHRCWVKSGEVPNITAGKEGNTCGAGAGSIKTHNYHGHLINGEFTDC